MTVAQVKSMCEILDLERGGTKETIVNRLMDFFLKPASSGKKLLMDKKRSKCWCACIGEDDIPNSSVLPTLVYLFASFLSQLCFKFVGSRNLIHLQGCHGTGKTGNLKVHFSRQGKHREFAKKILKICFYTGNLPPTQGKFLKVKKIMNL